MKISRVVSACLAASLAIAAPAGAQTPTAAPTLPIMAAGLTQPEFQGLGCLGGGTLAGAGVYAYSDILAVALTGFVNPLLLIPTMATGFAVGCAVGFNLAPAFLAIDRAL